MSYEALRHFADSWGLLLLTLVFVIVLLWVIRPGSRDLYRSHAEIPFEHDKDGG
jgi:cytochrome c oxidase cbb3-type subunit IV